ncbi:MAG: tyrosine-type recombinase/integrase [Rhodospirillales bacterium]|nr:tyrosine-type recombinase/integrase [Rhodospirillales bacterium]
MAKLTVARVKSLTRPGRYGDGATLYLFITPGGTKSWVQRVTIAGRRADIGLGAYPTISLARARQLAAANRTLIAEGGDPLEAKRKAAVPTFREAAERTFEASKTRWRNAKATANWMQQLEKYAFPILGGMRVDRVDREHLLRVLTPIWTTKPETARKVRQRMRATLAWAQAHGFVEHNLAADAISGALPVQKAVQAHFRSLPYQEVTEALKTIASSGSGGAAKLCLRWVVLTATRSGEARGAKWAEIDLEAREWRIPAQRMKSAADHVVPLSDAAMLVLGDAKKLRETCSDLVFPSPSKPGQTLSDATLTKVLRTVGLADRATVHGFRASFRTWAAECTSTPHAIMEAALAHRVPDSTERAYSRSDYRAQRRTLMQRWGSYVSASAGKVVALR